VELDRLDDAVRVLYQLEGAAARAVAATLTFGDRAELEPVRQALARVRVRACGD
jgi:DNA-binding GntR family transcriptional regulator